MALKLNDSWPTPVDEWDDETLQYIIDWCAININYSYCSDLEKRTFLNTFVALLDIKLKRNEC